MQHIRNCTWKEATKLQMYRLWLRMFPNILGRSTKFITSAQLFCIPCPPLVPPAHPCPPLPTVAHRCPRLHVPVLPMPTLALCPPPLYPFLYLPTPFPLLPTPEPPCPVPTLALVHGYTYGQDLWAAPLRPEYARIVYSSLTEVVQGPTGRGPGHSDLCYSSWLQAGGSKDVSRQNRYLSQWEKIFYECGKAMWSCLSNGGINWWFSLNLFRIRLGSLIQTVV